MCRFNHPSGRETESRSSEEVVLLQKVLVGIGDDVVQPKAALSEERYSKERLAMVPVFI